MYELSKRTSNFSDSVIRRMTRIANKYDAVNLSQGPLHHHSVLLINMMQLIFHKVFQILHHQKKLQIG